MSTPYDGHTVAQKMIDDAGATLFSVLASPDSCQECLGLAGRKFTFKDLPKIPHIGCTHKMGCRCDILPADDWITS